MECFEILNIPIDSDVKAVKKAYAKLVKLHNPEDDPKGYQEIRKAYDEALKVVKTKIKEINTRENKENNILDNDTEEITIHKEDKTKKENININDENIFDFYDNKGKYKKKTNIRDIKSIYNKGNYMSQEVLIKSKVEAFIAVLSAIYNNLEYRMDKEKWKQAFQNPVLWDVGAIELLDRSIIQFLLTHRYFPHDVYVMFDKYFEITRNELKLTKYFTIETLDEVISRINKEDVLSYDFIKEIPMEFLDEYLNLRELAYEYLERGDFEKAENFIKYAYKIYDKDPELIKLKGKLCYLNLNYRESKLYMRRALDINPNDKVALTILKKSNIFNYADKKINKFINDYIKYIRNGVKVIKICFYAMIAMCVLGFILTNFYDNNSHNIKNDEQKYKAVYDLNKSLEDKKINEEEMKENMFYAKLILAVHNNETCCFDLKDIKSTDYYILKDGNCIKINSDEYNELKDTVESRVYLGRIYDKIIAFSDESNHSGGETLRINTVGKEVSSKIFTQIMNENLEYVQPKEKWIENYIFVKSNEISANKFTGK